MEKLRALWEDKRLTLLFMVIGSALIFLYYSRKIPYIYTVWELADEYGYLANAAYMSGRDWSFMVDLYYGYGYSILLIPLFWIFDSGLSIIRGAVRSQYFSDFRFDSPIDNLSSVLRCKYNMIFAIPRRVC